MIPGTKFRAYRKRNGEGVHQSTMNPKGMTLTCKSFVGGVITCVEELSSTMNVQIFTRYWTIYELAPKQS